MAVYFECGRPITGPYGYLITTAIHHKDIYRNYIGVDASMADLMRPGMYGAYHEVQVSGKENMPKDHIYDVTGSLCGTKGTSRDYRGRHTYNRRCRSTRTGHGIQLQRKAQGRRTPFASRQFNRSDKKAGNNRRLFCHTGFLWSGFIQLKKRKVYDGN